MAFTNDQVGFERGATQLLLDREPRHLNRYNRSGPARTTTKSITGKPITVAYTQIDGEWTFELALEKLTDAKTTVLRTLADSGEPLTVKTTAGVATTYTAAISKIKIDPIIGPFTDGAPVRIRYHRAEITLSIEEEIP